MTWRYGILKSQGGYHVCERYDGGSVNGCYTDSISPWGETKEELVSVLKMMLEDVQKAVEADDVIEDKGE